MTAGEKSLFYSRRSARHFLISGTDAGRLRDVSPGKADDMNRALQTAYPDLLSAHAFKENALQTLDAVDCFSAAVIRLDPNPAQEPPLVHPPADENLVKVADILDAVCRDENGIWGIFGSGMLTGIFAEKNESQTIEIMRRIQTRIKTTIQQTITVGIAAYPTITFQKSDILQNAAKALDHASFFGPDSSVAFDDVSLNISGDRLYESGNIEGAIQELQTALKLDSSNVNVHNSLGVCFGVLGRYEPAIKEFEVALSLEPEEYMALYNLGLAYLFTQRSEQALELFLKANEINGAVYEVAFQTGKLYLELGDPQKAEIYLTRAADLEPSSGAVYRLLGDCHAADNKPRRAIAAYRKAIKLNPQDAASMSALGCLFEAQGENPEITMMFCRESVGLAPDNALFRYRLGRLYAKLNRLDDALKEFQKAQEFGHDAAEDIQKTIADLENR